MKKIHKPTYHSYERHGSNGIAEICTECSYDNVLVPVSFCPEAMKYIKAEDKLLDLTDEWHEGSGLGREIYEYFGWSEQEYEDWINSHEIPQWFIDLK